MCQGAIGFAEKGDRRAYGASTVSIKTSVTTADDSKVQSLVHES